MQNKMYSVTFKTFCDHLLYKMKIDMQDNRYFFEDLRMILFEITTVLIEGNFTVTQKFLKFHSF